MHESCLLTARCARCNNPFFPLTAQNLREAQDKSIGEQRKETPDETTQLEIHEDSTQYTGNCHASRKGTLLTIIIMLLQT